MNDYSKYKEEVEKQSKKLIKYIAKMGVDYDFNQKIEVPDQEAPLAEQRAMRTPSAITPEPRLEL